MHDFFFFLLTIQICYYSCVEWQPMGWIAYLLLCWKQMASKNGMRLCIDGRGRGMVITCNVTSLHWTLGVHKTLHSSNGTRCFRQGVRQSRAQFLRDLARCDGSWGKNVLFTGILLVSIYKECNLIKRVPTCLVKCPSLGLHSGVQVAFGSFLYLLPNQFGQWCRRENIVTFLQAFDHSHLSKMIIPVTNDKILWFLLEPFYSPEAKQQCSFIGSQVSQQMSLDTKASYCIRYIRGIFCHQRT